MDEEKKKTKEQGTPANSNEGVQSETDEKIKRINEDTARINEAIARNEEAKARAKLSGVTLSGDGEVLTGEEAEKAKSKKLADEIVGAFHN